MERFGEVDEEEEKEEVWGLRAMMVLLPLQVHLQKDVAVAVEKMSVNSEEKQYEGFVIRKSLTCAEGCWHQKEERYAEGESHCIEETVKASPRGYPDSRKILLEIEHAALRYLARNIRDWSCAAGRLTFLGLPAVSPLH